MPETISTNLLGTQTLNSSDNPLIVTDTGSVVGGRSSPAINAVPVPGAIIENSGSLEGGYGFITVNGGVGGDGVNLSSGQLSNEGFVGGGVGFGTFNPLVPGDTGGIGVSAEHFSQINNSGVISGGLGGYSIYYEGRAGQGGDGILFAASGQVTNSGVIFGGTGGSDTTDASFGGAGAAAVVFDGAGTVTNTGAIYGGDGGTGGSNFAGDGSGGAGLVFNSTGSLNNEVGGTIIGGTGGHDNGGGYGVQLDGGGSITDAGLIEGGADALGLGGIGVAVTAGGTLTVTSTGEIAGGASDTSGGAGVAMLGGTLTTAGTISGGSATSDSVLFDHGAPATLIVEQGAVFNGAIGGFSYGDKVDLTNVAPTYVESHFNAGTDTVNAAADGTLQFAGDPTLLFSSDGHGGTIITAACFRRGTRILTQQGERPVETLEIGDRVLTRDHELKPIRWIGRRHHAGPTLIGRRDVLPVLVKCGALGEQLPRRDLWVSPEHALYLNGALVPAGLLTNDVSILTDHSVSSVTYYHLEFEDHEVVFAEGAPCESFVDDDSRRMFDNAADYSRQYPSAEQKNPTFCAPRIEEGEALEALRGRLATLAGIAGRSTRQSSSPATELRA